MFNCLLSLPSLKYGNKWSFTVMGSSTYFFQWRWPQGKQSQKHHSILCTILAPHISTGIKDYMTDSCGAIHWWTGGVPHPWIECQGDCHIVVPWLMPRGEFLSQTRHCLQWHRARKWAKFWRLLNWGWSTGTAELKWRMLDELEQEPEWNGRWGSSRSELSWIDEKKTQNQLWVRHGTVNN